jgi:hypothetical protein
MYVTYIVLMQALTIIPASAMKDPEPRYNYMANRNHVNDFPISIFPYVKPNHPKHLQSGDNLKRGTIKMNCTKLQNRHGD